MVDSEYSADNSKSSKSSIGVVIKNQEMVKFVPDYLKSTKCVNMQLKNSLS